MNDTDKYYELRIRLTSEGSSGHKIALSGPDYGPIQAQVDDSLLQRQQEQAPEAYGAQLFNALFSAQAIRDAWLHLRSSYPQRRVRLDIAEDAPALHAIPWELLRDDSLPGKPYIAAVDATPFSRYLAGDYRPAEPIDALPLRILVAMANPANLGEYNLAALEEATERLALEEALDGLLSIGAAELEFLEPPCTLGRLEHQLRYGYHILHFIGHGSYPVTSRRRVSDEQPVLFMANDQNLVDRIQPAQLGSMLGSQLLDVTSDGGFRLRLVFMASCETAKRSSAEAFRGFAPDLVARGLPSVVAMQDLVIDSTARQFSRIFYERLLNHGLVDLAANEARRSLLTEEFSGSSAPVLFSRLPKGELIDFGNIKRPLPIQDHEPQTVFVPSGDFEMGGGRSQNSLPAQMVNVRPFRMGTYPVTNEEYAEFLDANRDHDRPADFRGTKPPQGKERHPVVNVSWYDAAAYCRWLSEETGRSYRLPTEAEWEKAARGVDGCLYPWGDQWIDGRCNVGGDETTEVCSHPDGRSPYGCEDMLGNVQEWTSTKWGSERNQSEFPLEYDSEDGREIDIWQNQEEDPLLPRVFMIHRGGSFASDPSTLDAADRGFYAAKSGFSRRGFRVARTISASRAIRE